MRLTRFALFAVLALVVLSFSQAPHASAAYRSSTVAFFYADLEPYGRWVDHPIYGTVWVPATHQPGWAPYYDGRWVWTADYGWYWDSYEDFGWATYHYGRWVLTSDLGWVWVPDDLWGPAWVDWRYSDDGYVGWAPMPPEYRWSGRGFATASVDLSAPRYSSRWIFVTELDFARANPRGHRVPPDRNRSLIGASVRVTDYAAIDGRIVNRSIDAVRLSSKTNVRISAARIGTAASIGERARIRAAGYVPLFQPQVHAASKLDLDVGAGNTPSINSDINATTGVDANPPIDNRSGSVDVGGSASGGFDRPIGGGLSGGIGGGIGLGGGGGIRLGR
jgi:hypothetical protein